MSCDVLIVDDDESIAEVLSINLTYRGITAVTAGTGAEGIGAVASEAPAVVLLDIRLPDMDGWEVCRKIKEPRPGVRIPKVIFITAATQLNDRKMAKEAGGDGFIDKPFDIEEIVAIVKRFLAVLHG